MATEGSGTGAFDAPVVTDVQRHEAQVLAAVSHGAVDAVLAVPAHVAAHEVEAALDTIPAALDSELAALPVEGDDAVGGGIEDPEGGVAAHLDAALQTTTDPEARYHIRQALQHEVTDR